MLLWDDKNVLELDRNGSCMTLWTYKMPLKWLILSYVNFTSIKKKLKYLENSKYLLGIKYVIAQIKHSVDCVPIICCLLSAPTLLPALLISETEILSWSSSYTRALQIPGVWNLGPNLSLWTQGLWISPAVIFLVPECRVGIDIIGIGRNLY